MILIYRCILKNAFLEKRVTVIQVKLGLNLTLFYFMFYYRKAHFFKLDLQL